MSHPYLASEAKVRGDILRVSKEQQKLADQHGWARTGPPNVPAGVIQDAKDFATRSRTLVNKLEAERVHQAPLNHHQLASGSQRDGSEDGDDSDHSKIPWSPSPERDEHMHWEAQEAKNTSRMPSASTEREALSDLEVQEARAPARIPASASTEVADVEIQHPLLRPVQDPLPSSSMGSDAELDIEIPQAITAPPNRMIRALQVAQPQSTPPSAQIVPSTFNERNSSVRKSDSTLPEPKRRRKHKQIVWDSSQPAGSGVSSHKHNGNESNASVLPETQTSTSTSSGSIIATVDFIKDELPHEMPTASSHQHAAPDYTPDVLIDLENNSSGLRKLPPNGPASQVPFTAFTLAYTNYGGSLGDFVRAVICIQGLQKTRALPEFLYDDFIRVFSGDYLEYIGSLEETQKPLTTIQWYNEYVQRPQYTKGIVSRASLTNVVSSYSKEFREARLSLGMSTDSSTPRKLETDNDRREVTSTQSSARGSPIVADRPSSRQPEPKLFGENIETSNVKPRSPTGKNADGSSFYGFAPKPTRPDVAEQRNQQTPFQTALEGHSTPTSLRLQAGQHNERTPVRAVHKSHTTPTSVRSQVEDEPILDRNSSSPPLPEHSTPMTTTGRPSRSALARSYSIPETEIKAKAPPRPSLGAPPVRPSPTQMFRFTKPTEQDPAERSARWGRYLRKRKEQMQSSAAPSSIAD